MSEFKSCPVCQEQSDQCLPCGSYVVDGERIYYEKLKDFGATKDHEVRFINRIQKHRTTAFFHNGKLYIPSRQGRSVPLAIGLQWDAWQEQQAIIDQLNSVVDERTKEWLQAIELGAYFENVAKPLKEENDRLKAQLNNMEACYIEKKKELEELQGKSRCIKSLVEQRNLAENMLRKISVAAQKKLPTFGAALRFNDEVKEILRGAND